MDGPFCTGLFPVNAGSHLHPFFKSSAETALAGKAGEKAAQEQTKGKAKKSESA